MEKKEDTYWEQKIRFFLHDPMDKVLNIPGHENRAKKIAEAFGVSTPEKSEVALADIVASGLDRASLPGYHKNGLKNGAIDFVQKAQLTHPISGMGVLSFTGEFNTAEATTDQIVNIIEGDTNQTNRVWSKQDYFNYLFLYSAKDSYQKIAGTWGTCG